MRQARVTGTLTQVEYGDWELRIEIMQDRSDVVSLVKRYPEQLWMSHFDVVIKHVGEQLKLASICD